MKTILKIISALALAMLVVAPSLFYAGRISLEQNKHLLLAATIVWFAASPFWMLRRGGTSDRTDPI